MKLDVSSGLLIFCGLFTPIFAHTFVQAPFDSTNPLDGTDEGSFCNYFCTDVDFDGDIDCFVGEGDATAVVLLENIGTPASPDFELHSGTKNPFSGVTFSDGAPFPWCADLDNDGDDDCFVTSNSGTARYFQNQGVANTFTLTELTGTSNPLNGFILGVGLGNEPSICLADFNGDSLIDAIVGANDGLLKYFANTGTVTSPAYTELTGVDNPFNSYSVVSYATPTTFDYDQDGDFDLFVGSFSTGIYYLENNGDFTFTTYDTSDYGNPLHDLVILEGEINAFLADFDNDGSYELVVGSYFRSDNYYEGPEIPVAPCAAGPGQYSIDGTCYDCPSGTYNPNSGSTTADDCLSCGVGKYSSSGSDDCMNCGVGTYNPSTGQSSCTGCSVGKFNLNAGSTSAADCMDCPAGKFQDDTGKAICQGCQVGKYNADTGQSSCTSCPDGASTADKGSDSSSDCGSCGNGFSMIDGGCYRGAKQVNSNSIKPYAWVNAKTACANLGGWLATFDDRDHYDMVVDDVVDNWFGGKTFWVGGKKVGSSYLWQTGSMTGMMIDDDLWADNEPAGASNQICVQAGYLSGESTGGLDNYRCNVSKYALCMGSVNYA